MKVLDMQVVGKDDSSEHVPQTVLKGILLIGDLGLDTKKANPLPRELSIGIANASSLDNDL